MSVTGNLTIIILTFMDSHLKTPMYFFFKNFAFLEVSFTMLCIPRFLYSIISGNNTITYNTWRSEVKFAQSCPTLWDSKYCSPPGSSVHGVLQARIPEWVAIPFSGGSSWPRDWTWVSCIAGRFFTVWATREVQEYWSGLPFPFQGLFQTQRSNQVLLRCRQILYQLSHQWISKMENRNSGSVPESHFNQ